MRPEVFAFRELDTLVRNLSDQLAGYRRRAMAAEARVRELDALVVATREGDVQVAVERDALREELAAVQHELAEARLARARAEAQAATAAASALAVAAERASTPVPAARAETAEAALADAALADAALVEENANLRTLLQEARERTVQLAERMRFLRQQIGQGAEK